MAYLVESLASFGRTFICSLPCNYLLTKADLNGANSIASHARLRGDLVTRYFSSARSTIYVHSSHGNRRQRRNIAEKNLSNGKGNREGGENFTFPETVEETRRVIRSAKMSWQSYVDEHLMCDIEGQHLTAAAIVGHDGCVWAQSEKFPQFKVDEIKAIMTDFEQPGHLAPTGLHVGGTKYMVIQGEPGTVIRGKKGSGGITIKKTGQGLVFGIYDEPMTPGQCNMIVERLGDYLVDQAM